MLGQMAQIVKNLCRNGQEAARVSDYSYPEDLNKKRKVEDE